jgi:hypothetical protein
MPSLTFYTIIYDNCGMQILLNAVIGKKEKVMKWWRYDFEMIWCRKDQESA